MRSEFLSKAPRVTLARLRREAPAWSWKASRHGFGWSYVGMIAQAHSEAPVSSRVVALGPWQVRVYAVARLVGFAGDDFETEWRVENGEGEIDTYAVWWLRHGQ